MRRIIEALSKAGQGEGNGRYVFLLHDPERGGRERRMEREGTKDGEGREQKIRDRRRCIGGGQRFFYFNKAISPPNISSLIPRIGISRSWHGWLVRRGKILL